MTVSADKHRNSRLPVMVNTDELALLNLVAEHAGLGTGTWARERLLVAARRELIDYVMRIPLKWDACDGVSETGACVLGMGHKGRHFHA